MKKRKVNVSVSIDGVRINLRKKRKVSYNLVSEYFTPALILRIHNIAITKTLKHKKKTI